MLTAELDGNDPARRPRAVSEDDITGVKGHVLVDEGDHVGGGEGDGEDGRLHGAHQADLCSEKDENVYFLFFSLSSGRLNDAWACTSL